MTTNFATANYQEVIDLHTESDTVSVIGIHSPCTDTPMKMLSGFWRQFRKMKYNGCSISLVPAARLPADPLQVSYAAGETTIDPRDMLNPIMFHGCHGDNMGSILNMLYSGQASTTDIARNFGDSIEQNVFDSKMVGNDFVDALYYKALTDNTWKKAHPQSGFRKSGLRPMVHSVVASAPFGMQASPSEGTGLYPAPDGGTIRYGEMGFDNGGALKVKGTPGLMNTAESPPIVTDVTPQYNSVSLMTSKLYPLGWQDTYSVHQNTAYTAEIAGNATADAKALGDMFSSYYLNEPLTVPKVFMGMIMLPPAYKTEQYFRLIINHNFAFKGFRGASMDTFSTEMVNNAPSVFNFN
nr:MAG: capsid protein [ssDNA virus sp.]